MKKKKPRLAMRGYSLFYTDKKTGAKKDGVIYSRLLHSEKYGLTGKPDFIFKRGRNIVPVELKSGEAGDAPREGDLMQLAVYFIIVHEEFGLKPRYGRLIYRNTMFIIKNERQLRRRVLDLAEEMRDALINGGVADDVSANFVKCRHCICRGTVCSAKQ